MSAWVAGFQWLDGKSRASVVSAAKVLQSPSVSETGRHYHYKEKCRSLDHHPQRQGMLSFAFVANSPEQLRAWPRA